MTYYNITEDVLVVCMVSFCIYLTLAFLLYQFEHLQTLLQGEASDLGPEHGTEPHIFAQTGLGQTQVCYRSQYAQLGLELSQHIEVWRLVYTVPDIRGTANIKRFAKLSTGWSLLYHDWKALKGDTFIHRCLYMMWELSVETHGLCYTKSCIWSQSLLALKSEKLRILFKESLCKVLHFYSTTHGDVRINEFWGVRHLLWSLFIDHINKLSLRTKQS